MASFTSVGDETTLMTYLRGDTVAIALSGTYNMTILCQRENGSVGSGSWETLKTYTTENATVADAVFSTQERQRFRLVVTVDGGGTCTATLTGSSNNVQHQLNDDNGVALLTITGTGTTVEGTLTVDGTSTLTGNVSMAGTLAVTGATTLTGASTHTAAATFNGPIVYGAPIDCTAATLAVDAATHAGKLITLNRAGGIDITMPAATGTGNVYTFIVGTTTTDAYDWSPTGDDIFKGTICGADADAEFIWSATSAAISVTLGGANQETGGTNGDKLTFIDYAADRWAVHGFIEHGSGTEATPFSNS